MTWVWLRGLARESGHWGGLPRMAELATGDKVITLDLPGMGIKRNQECPWHMADIVNQLMQETEHLDSIKLMGVSLGGLVAMHWAAADHRVKQLLVVNSSSRLSLFYRRLNLASAWRLLMAFIANNSAEEQEQKVLNIVSNEPVRARQIVSLWSEIARRRPVSLRQVVRQLVLAAIAGVPHKKDLQHCQIKIIASDGDQLVAPTCSRRLAEYLGCSLVTHPSAGHDLPLDDPDWLLHQIDELIIEDEMFGARC